MLICRKNELNFFGKKKTKKKKNFFGGMIADSNPE